MECELQKYAIGYKNITMNDNFFTGHFPERAIMPGDLAMLLVPERSSTQSYITPRMSTDYSHVHDCGSIVRSAMWHPERQGWQATCKQRRTSNAPSDDLMAWE